MLIQKSQTLQKNNSINCLVTEYPFIENNLGIAIAKIHGRYPLENKAKNTECDQIYLVIKGHGIIHHQTGIYQVQTGDAFYFNKKQWYWIEGNHLEIIVTNTPSWNPKQYKIIQ